MGWLDQKPVGCIAGVRYNPAYGFIGMFLVVPHQRGKGYGVALWRHALQHLEDVPCIGLEATPDRVADYGDWGFQPGSTTTRWQRLGDDGVPFRATPMGPLQPAATGPAPAPAWCLLTGEAIPEEAVQRFDAQREPSPRPHFLHCHGFRRIRPCLLKEGDGWRIGPLVADHPAAAKALVEGLLQRHDGPVLKDGPGANPQVGPVLEALGFQPIAQTLRMYRGPAPQLTLADVYGLACLELG